MAVNDLLGAQVKILGKGKISIATATTTSIDFGTPDDINLAATGTVYRPGDRILVELNNSTAGTTDTTGWVIQTAPDSSGSIGTPVTATTDASPQGDALAGGTGDRYGIFGVRIPAGHSWIRVRATRASGTTDTTVVQATVYAIPRGL